MPHHRSRVTTRSSKIAELFQSSMLAADVLSAVAVNDCTQAGRFGVSIPSNTQVVTKQGLVSAGTLRPGDRIIACGGSREITELAYETVLSPVFNICPGVLDPTQGINLLGNQVIRIVDSRVTRLFGMNYALVRVEDLDGLAGVTSLGMVRHISVELRLAVSDAIFVETLWLEATAGGSSFGTDPHLLTADEARLVLTTPLPPRGVV